MCAEKNHDHERSQTKKKKEKTLSLTLDRSSPLLVMTNNLKLNVFGRYYVLVIIRGLYPENKNASDKIITIFGTI